MKVLSIQTSLAKPMTIGGKTVMTGISKTPVEGRVRVTALGLEGDEQVDRSVHGGIKKAVYAYPSEHYGYWRDQAARTGAVSTLPYGSMGENLTLSGLLEREAFVGDELRFSDCVLRITEPRRPCFKFNAVMNDRLAGKKMAQTGFSGFYLSVVEEGTIAPGETFELCPGAREVAIGALAAVSRLKTRSD
jgi:MOSC domain-containing protein YiiM